MDDVRMRGFARRSTVAQAWQWLESAIEPLPPEVVPLDQAAGRILAEGLRSAVDVPAFDRAMMDGLALRATDTLGASPYNRVALNVMGQVLPGTAWTGCIVPGQALRIMTGAAMPDGADAVLPAELVALEGSRAWALGEVAPGKHVGRVGEDVTAGSLLLPAGRRLRPQDLGAAASIGFGQLPVVRRPRVAIVITGNELLPAGSRPQGVRIVDANGPMLAALAGRDGAQIVFCEIVPDRPEAVLEAMRASADVVLVSGGSSVGVDDHAARLLGGHGELAVHGIAMRPSSPAGMGRLEGRLVFLLPGNPVSCLCAYDFFAGRAVRGLGARSPDWPYRRIRAPLARKIASEVGRLDYIRVRLAEGQVEPLAIGGASVLSSTVRADGFVLVGEDSEGQPAGGEVEVLLYDP